MGDRVEPDRVGQRVWVYFAAWQRQYGIAAEHVCLPARQAVPLPDSASHDLGVSLGIPAITAHRCLFADGSIEGQSVLVAGGAGAVGHYAIELARRAGATIVIYAIDDEFPVNRQLMVANTVLRGVLVYTMGHDAVGRAVTDVNAAVADGDLSELPAHRFTLDQTAAAHDAVQQGAVGKVLIDL